MAINSHALIFTRTTLC